MTENKQIIERNGYYCIEPCVEIKELKEQLSRKTQECEELKKQIESDKGLITDAGKQNYQLIQELDQLKVKNEKLKANNAEWKTFDVSFDNGFIKTQISDMSLAEYSQVKLERDRAEQKLDTIRKYCNYMTAFNNANKTNKGLDAEEVIKIIDEVE